MGLFRISRELQFRVCNHPEPYACPRGKGRTLLKREGSWEGYRKQRTHDVLLAEWVSEVAQSCLTLCDPMDCEPTRFLCPWDFPGKSTGVGCHSLLQRISPTEGSNPGLPHCRQTLYSLSQRGGIDWVLPGKEEDSSFCCALRSGRARASQFPSPDFIWGFCSLIFYTILVPFKPQEPWLQGTISRWHLGSLAPIHKSGWQRLKQLLVWVLPEDCGILQNRRSRSETIAHWPPSLPWRQFW